MYLSKPRSIKDPLYLKYVRGYCVVHAYLTDVDASHLIARGMGGKGQKGSDYYTVGMCRCCHTEFHSLGLSAFEKKYQVNLWREAFELFMKWLSEGNTPKVDIQNNASYSN